MADMALMRDALPDWILARIPDSVKSRLTNAGKSETDLTVYDRAYFERLADMENAKSGNLTDVDCPKCGGKGRVAVIAPVVRPAGDGFELRYAECDCMKRWRCLKNLRESGLADMLSRYTLENWQCREPWQAKLLEAVKRYAEKPEGWFVLTGRPGTGKTHLCTALCGLLLKQGLSVRYMLWRDVAVRAKAAVNDSEAYAAIVEPLKRVRVLYIDDFWKTGRAANYVSGQLAPTVGDINLAFELLNARYANSRLLTIISAEMSIGEMLDVDEALGGRVQERANTGLYCDLSEFNDWRITGGR